MDDALEEEVTDSPLTPPNSHATSLKLSLPGDGIDAP